MKKPISTADRERKAYELARQYLLSLPSAVVTETLLYHYLNPLSNQETPNTGGDNVFRRLLESAQNRGHDGYGPEFMEWVRVFDVDDRKRAALPMLLSQEIDGFGFALACDFLKELGFTNFAKPDVHIKALVKGLGLSSKTANDYAVFKAVVRIASHCGKTPYDVDKLFWLVGSGRFYDHPTIGKNGRIRTNRTGFVRNAKRKLEAAA